MSSGDSGSSSVGVDDLSQAGRRGSDAPRSTVGDAQSQGNVGGGAGAEGRLRNEAGPVGDGNVKGVADSKAQDLKPDEVSRAESKGSEAKSVGDRARNPDVKSEVSAKVGVDEQVGSVSQAQAKGSEARGIAGDPSGAAKSRASVAGEGEARSHVPGEATSAKSEVDSAASVGRDPKGAAESKARSEVQGDVRVDVGTKPDDPSKK